jgi:hypothetical protein
MINLSQLREMFSSRIFVHVTLRVLPFEPYKLTAALFLLSHPHIRPPDAVIGITELASN